MSEDEIRIRTTSGGSLYFLALVLTVFMGAYILSVLSISTALLVAVGFSVFVLCFASTRVAIYLLIFSMLLSPEFGAMHGNIAEGRSVVVRLDDVLLVVISLSWLARLATLKEGVGLFRRTPVGRPIAAYVSVLIMATILGVLFDRIQPGPGFFYSLKYVEYIVIFYMMVNHLETAEQANNILWAAFITCAVICLYAIIQIPTGGRVTAPFEGAGGEPNTLGGYLVLMLSMIIGLLLTLKPWRARLVFGALGVLIAIPLGYTLSRSSWIALIPMYITFLIFSRKKTGLIISAALLITISPVFLPEQVTERVMSTFQEERWHGTTEKIGGIAFDPSTSERITRYKQSLGRWTKHPVLGYGVTGGGFIDGQFLRTLEETGLIGLVTMLWLIYSIFKTSYRNYKNLPSPLFKGLALGLMAGVAALLGHAVGSSTFIIVRIMEPFWLMAAIVVRSPDLIKDDFVQGSPGDKTAALKERLNKERPIEEGVVV